MNPSKNDFLAKDEDDEDDMCHQICTFIDHRVYNPSLIIINIKILFDNLIYMFYLIIYLRMKRNW